MNMRVLIDGHMLGSGEGGNERYIESLSDALFDFNTLEIRVSTPENYIRRVDVSRKKFFIKQHSSSDIARVFYELPKRAAEFKANIIHATYIGPINTSTELVLTVHDLAFKRFPEFFSLRERLIFNCLLPLSMRKAGAIIVPSRFTRGELLELFPEYKDKIFTTYEAASKVFKPMDRRKAQRKVNEKMRVQIPFILAFNGRIAKKNINRVIDSFSRISSDFPDLQLVIVGGKHHIRKSKHELKRIKILKDITDEELNLLYNATELVIYYSVYEGFGLPILEAFSCQTPVVASDIPVHREIIGDVPLYANPRRSGELADRIRRLMSNSKLREKIGQEGSRLASVYNWRKTAKDTIKAYKYALSKK